MTFLHRIRIGFLAAVAVAALALPAESGSGDASLRAIEQASLTAEERQALRGKIQAAHLAGVPADDVEIIVTRGIGRGAGAATLGRFLDTSSRVAREGLPVRPVLDRIEQGLSKGVPPERIDAAGKRLADGLAQAKPLIDGLAQRGMPAGAGGARDAALESAARAYELSLAPSSLERLGEAVRTQGQTMEQFDQAMRTLSFLAGSGMRADAAERVVRACIDRSFTEHGYARLERTVDDMVRQGRSMDDIVRTAEREAREGRGHGENRDGGKQDRGPGGGRDAGARPGRGR